jgi:AmmeMemoRadiSam system protein B
MSLIFSCIAPHPPIIIPTIGQENLKKVSKTISALKLLNNRFVQQKPDSVLVISPHAPLFPNAFAINRAQTLAGDFGNFGDAETRLQFKNDLDLVKQITKNSLAAKISINKIENENLDHGSLVPLYYLTASSPKIKLNVIGFSFLSLDTHFHFGQVIWETIKAADEKIAVIASGDLSHRLTHDAPAGFHPDGLKFDKKIIDLLKKKEIEKILNLDPEFIGNAGECGLRSIVILLGILSKIKYGVEILSYEGPFGVGYLVANLKNRDISLVLSAG